MVQDTQKENVRIFIDWALTNALIIPVSYLVSLIVVLIFAGLFGISVNEWGSHFEQTVMQMAGAATLAFGTGWMQKKKLKELFGADSSWMVAIIAGFIAAEIITGLVTWQLHLNRMQLRFIEFNVLPEALIFAVAGLITGFLQWLILKNSFSKSIYWIFASASGWGICILTMVLSHFTEPLNNVVFLYIMLEIAIFTFGAFLYGAITGATLIWIMKRKIH